MKKRIIFTNIILIIIPTIVFAEDNSYNNLTIIAKKMLNALQWMGYAIALGTLILVGIKYMFSPTNEKANLKGKLITYVMGVGLIVLCSTLAGAIALVANADGKNTADGVVKEGIEIAGAEVTQTTNKGETEAWPKKQSVRDENGNKIGVKYTNEDGSYAIEKYRDLWGYDIEKEEYYNEKEELIREKTYNEDGVYEEFIYTSTSVTENDVIKNELLPEIFSNYELKYIDSTGDGQIDTIEFYDSKGNLVREDDYNYSKVENGEFFSMNLNYSDISKENYVKISRNQQGENIVVSEYKKRK